MSFSNPPRSNWRISTIINVARREKFREMVNILFTIYY